MNKHHFITYCLQCSTCGKKFDKELINYINPKINIDALKIVRSFEPVETVCPHCGESVCKVHKIIYEDSDKGFIIQYAPRKKDLKFFVEENDKNYTEANDLFGEQKTIRIVYQYYKCFIEKVEIFNAGLNDITFVMYKELLYLELDDKTISDIYVAHNNETNEISFLIVRGDDGQEFYPIDWDVYNNLNNVMRVEPFYNRYNDYIIDRDFFPKLMNFEENNTPIHIDILNSEEE